MPFKIMLEYIFHALVWICILTGFCHLYNLGVFQQ